VELKESKFLTVWAAIVMPNHCVAPLRNSPVPRPLAGRL
jgi:hypothetical protein